MEVSELKKYTKNLDAFTAEEVENLSPMTEEEFEAYQHELDHDTGAISTWDSIRALITLKQESQKLKELVKRAHDIMSFHTYRCPMDIINNFSGSEEHLAEYREVKSELKKMI